MTLKRKNSAHLNMSTPTNRKARNYSYPETTSGAKTAKKLRSETNKLSEAKRESLFKRGMQVIYGGTGTKETVGSGR